MVPDPQETGLLKDQNFKVSKQLLLKVMKEFTDQIFLVWEFFLFNSQLEKAQIHTDLMEVKLSQSLEREIMQLDKQLPLIPALERHSNVSQDSIPLQKLHIIKMEEFFNTS